MRGLLRRGEGARGGRQTKRRGRRSSAGCPPLLWHCRRRSPTSPHAACPAAPSPLTRASPATLGLLGCSAPLPLPRKPAASAAAAAASAPSPAPPRAPQASGEAPAPAWRPVRTTSRAGWSRRGTARARRWSGRCRACPAPRPPPPSTPWRPGSCGCAGEFGVGWAVLAQPPPLPIARQPSTARRLLASLSAGRVCRHLRRPHHLQQHRLGAVQAQGRCANGWVGGVCRRWARLLSDCGGPARWPCPHPSHAHLPPPPAHRSHAALGLGGGKKRSGGGRKRCAAQQGQGRSRRQRSASSSACPLASHQPHLPSSPLPSCQARARARQRRRG